ncbi:flagellar motor switch protein FliG [Oceanospirillaceae bacterium]|jgi:flagellar motor switch protein FliG|nr:flagellar motor switch protein FliG [Oceanospirillaceae bacterium]MDB9905527.1 flagellar motor switch protein FliG [Oceanospirillaceae bacterium]MDC1352524.1 flagellar motor switch protein FliG [Oceanospirillaceae bacterium]MDO7554701.1 flagellar motor switch protein FliG [Oceanospirillaceae bacterium]HAW17852.1 flagellar motor switch protein FliG [Oceanospirillaceae bacterium]
MADKKKLEPDVDLKKEDEFQALTKTQKTAIIMMVLGEEEAANVVSHLPPREVQHLGAAMVSVANVSQGAVDMVLDEFVLTMKQQTNLSMGTSDYVQRVFNKALGEDKASSVLNRIIPTRASNGLDILNWMDARSIAEMIRGEHPQIISIIVSFLEHEIAADVLHYLPEDLRADIIMRVAQLETIQPEALEELETIMQKQFTSNSAVKSSNVGGVNQAAKIMNFTKSDMETQIMGNLMERDEDLTGRIQDNMFVFDNLSGVDARSIQVLIRNIETDLLMVALKGADDLVKDTFLENMSKRAGVLFLDDMEAKGPMRISEVEEAQKDILRTARRLSDAGEMMLGGGADFV